VRILLPYSTIAVHFTDGTKDTTRSPRAGETDGVEYHFTTPEGFEELINKDAFIEHATFAGRSYGTSFAAVRDVTSKGRACILDIEMEVVPRSPSSQPAHLLSTLPVARILSRDYVSYCEG